MPSTSLVMLDCCKFQPTSNSLVRKSNESHMRNGVDKVHAERNGVVAADEEDKDAIDIKQEKNTLIEAEKLETGDVC